MYKKMILMVFLLSQALCSFASEKEPNCCDKVTDAMAKVIGSTVNFLGKQPPVQNGCDYVQMWARFLSGNNLTLEELEEFERKRKQRAMLYRKNK